MVSSLEIMRGRPLADQISQKQVKRPENELAWRVRPLDNLVSGFLFICGAISILTTVGFVLVLGSEALKFFTTTEWLNANKRTAIEITAEDTIFPVTTTGTSLQAGDLVRVGQLGGSEIVEVIGIRDDGFIEVARGQQGTQAVDHPTNTPMFTAARVTLTKYFTETKWAPQMGNLGVAPLLSSTLRVAFIAMIVSIPLGLSAAIYLSEYASVSARGIIKPILEILAGVPTVVYGYFALTFITPLLRSIFGVDSVEIYNVASAGIVVGILIIPTISSISEDALAAVPNALREASYGMGATRLETISRVLLPGALSGITAAIILGVSRAVGETMIVLIAAGAGPSWTFDNFQAAETMAGHIARISTGDLSYGSIDYNSVFAIGLTLFFMTLLLNFVSTLITRRFREVYA